MIANESGRSVGFLRRSLLLDTVGNEDAVGSLISDVYHTSDFQVFHGRFWFVRIAGGRPVIAMARRRDEKAAA